jgi:hypothetical protein
MKKGSRKQALDEAQILIGEQERATEPRGTGHRLRPAPGNDNHKEQR